MKRISSIILALCLLGSQVAHAAVGTEGVGGDSTIGIEIGTSQDQRVDLNVFVEDEAGTPLEGVNIKLLDADNSDIPPITGSDQTFMTDATGHLLIKLFPQNRQYFQIKIEHTGYEPYASGRFQVTQDTEHTAVLKLAVSPPDTDYHTVYYYALEGGSVDRKSEQVRWNQTPTQVPRAKAEEGWEFVGWTLDGNPVVPETVRIRKTTRFYAEFQALPPMVSPAPTPVATATPAPTPTPAHTPRPTPIPAERPDVNPVPDGSVPAGAGSGGDGGSGSGEAEDGGGDNPTTPPSGETSAGGEETAPPAASKVPQPGTISPETPEEEHPSEAVECHLHWIVLILILATALSTALRLRAIRRRIEEEELAQWEEVSTR